MFGMSFRLVQTLPSRARTGCTGAHTVVVSVHMMIAFAMIASWQDLLFDECLWGRMFWCREPLVSHLQPWLSSRHSTRAHIFNILLWRTVLAMFTSSQSVVWAEHRHVPTPLVTYLHGLPHALVKVTHSSIFIVMHHAVSAEVTNCGPKKPDVSLAHCIDVILWCR